MKIVIPGGTGQVGGVLRRALAAEGHDVTVLSRRTESLEAGVRHAVWDGRSVGRWTSELDGADAVINLAGRSVSCRYTDANLKQMMDSRVDSAKVIGEAIAVARRPPKTWLQMSTATIYAHTLDGTNDEATGVIGGNEPDVPDYWEYSVRIARNWEAAQGALELGDTRRVALRAAMVMTPDQGGIFDALSTLTRLGVGGPVAGGRQKVSWVHGDDFVQAVLFLLGHDEIEGPVNIASPNPLPQRDLMAGLRKAWKQNIGLPATRRMADVGAWALGSDPELLLKSRSVVPGRLLDADFAFAHPIWESAARDLVTRARLRPEGVSLLRSLGRLMAMDR